MMKLIEAAEKTAETESAETATVIFLRQRKGLESRKMRGCGGEGG